MKTFAWSFCSSLPSSHRSQSSRLAPLCRRSRNPETRANSYRFGNKKSVAALQWAIYLMTWALRCEMKRADEDYTGLSRGVSLLATSTPSVQKKVGLLVLSTPRLYTKHMKLVFRMDAFNVCLVAIGSCQGSGGETRGLYGRRRSR